MAFKWKSLNACVWFIPKYIKILLIPVKSQNSGHYNVTQTTIVHRSGFKFAGYVAVGVTQSSNTTYKERNQYRFKLTFVFCFTLRRIYVRDLTLYLTDWPPWITKVNKLFRHKKKHWNLFISTGLEQYRSRYCKTRNASKALRRLDSHMKNWLGILNTVRKGYSRI